METYEIVDKYLSPRLDSECRRLGIPRDFIADTVPHTHPGIKPITCKDGKKRVVLFISGEHDSTPGQALSDFYYALRLAKAEYEEKDVSNFRATLYAEKRKLQNFLEKIF